jgi:hypothetical protein
LLRSQRSQTDTHADRINGEQRAILQFGSHPPQRAYYLSADRVRADVRGTNLRHAGFVAVHRRQDGAEVETVRNDDRAVGSRERHDLLVRGIGRTERGPMGCVKTGVDE